MKVVKRLLYFVLLIFLVSDIFSHLPFLCFKHLFLVDFPLVADFTLLLLRFLTDVIFFDFRDAWTFLVASLTLLSSVLTFFLRHLPTLDRVCSLFCWRRHSSIRLANSTSFDTSWNDKCRYLNFNFFHSFPNISISSTVKASTNEKPCHKRFFWSCSNLWSKSLSIPFWYRAVSFGVDIVKALYLIEN